jgi:hypothetical protein
MIKNENGTVINPNESKGGNKNPPNTKHIAKNMRYTSIALPNPNPRTSSLHRRSSCGSHVTEKRNQKKNELGLDTSVFEKNDPTSSINVVSICSVPNTVSYAQSNMLTINILRLFVDMLEQALVVLEDPPPPPLDDVFLGVNVSVVEVSESLTHYIKK